MANTNQPKEIHGQILEFIDSSHSFALVATLLAIRGNLTQVTQL